MTIESYRTMGSYKKGHQDSVVLHNIGAYGTGGERTRGGGGSYRTRCHRKGGLAGQTFLIGQWGFIGQGGLIGQGVLQENGVLQDGGSGGQDTGGLAKQEDVTEKGGSYWTKVSLGQWGFIGQ